MTYYWMGDRPVSALVLTPTRQGEAIALSDFSSVAATHVQPDGMSVFTDTSATIDDGVIRVEFTGTDWFDQPGLHQLRLALLAEGGGRERLDAIQIVVHDDDGWHTLPSIRSEWRDAPDKDELLYQLLESSKRQVLAYAPDLADGAMPPLHYRQAQRDLARDMWNAGRVDPSGSAGDESFTLTPFPLSWHVKQLLRPRTADPVAT